MRQPIDKGLSRKGRTKSKPSKRQLRRMHKKWGGEVYVVEIVAAILFALMVALMGAMLFV